MGEEMLLAGQRVAPARLVAAGFTFGQPDIDSGLASALAG
jgi:NAD dependent epimerase/dehydratase family enzyme